MRPCNNKNIVYLSKYLLNRKTRQCLKQNFDRVSRNHFSTTCVKSKVICSSLKPVTIPDATLPEYFEPILSKWNDRIALECFETGRKLSYIELLAKSKIIAANLRNKIGLEDNDTVSVILPNVIEFPAITLGIITANCVCSPGNPLYTPEEHRKQFISSKPKCIITLDLFYPAIKKAMEGLSQSITVILLQTNPNTKLPTNTINYYLEIENPNTNLDILKKLKRPSLNDTVMRPYSSGTTGLPKGVDLTHRNVVATSLQMRGFGTETYSLEEFGVDYPLIEPAILPFFHIFGLNVIMLGRLAIGHTLIAMPQFSSEKFLQMLKKHQPHCLKLVPPLVMLIISNPNITKDELKNVGFIFTAAAPISGTDLERLKQKTKSSTRITQGYGLTETTGVVANYVPSIPNYTNTSIGGLAPNTDARIIDIDTGKDVERGQTGEIWVRGPQNMKGYHENEQATKESITDDGWFKTGDIGYVDPNGLFYLTDRMKELIKVKGFQVAPAELEGILRTHPDVQDCAVVGVPNQFSGEAPKAFIVPKSGTNLNEKEIQEFVAKKVSDYKRLTGGVAFIDQIPKSATGKILRRQLKKQLV